jgi:hypothetical protein
LKLDGSRTKKRPFPFKNNTSPGRPALVASTGGDELRW